jgi:hypothetical protein
LANYSRPFPLYPTLFTSIGGRANLKIKEMGAVLCNWCQAHYGTRSGVLTRNEQTYYFTLKEVVGERLSIYAKVKMEDIFFAKKGNGYLTARNKISSRHVDFLLYQRSTLKPVLGKIDDISHNQQDWKKRDHFENSLFEVNNIPLLRVKARRSYGKEYVSHEIISILSDTISL